jgi:hypothetical protein
MQDADGFQREHRVEPAPSGGSQLPEWARWGIVAALAILGIAVIAVLFATGGLSFGP